MPAGSRGLAAAGGRLSRVPSFHMLPTAHRLRWSHAKLHRLRPLSPPSPAGTKPRWVTGAGEQREPRSRPVPSRPCRHTQPQLPGKGRFANCRSWLPARFRQLHHAPLLLAGCCRPGAGRGARPGQGYPVPGASPAAPPKAPPRPSSGSAATSRTAWREGSFQGAWPAVPRGEDVPRRGRDVPCLHRGGHRVTERHPPSCPRPPSLPGHRQRRGRGQRRATSSSPSQDFLALTASRLCRDSSLAVRGTPAPPRTQQRSRVPHEHREAVRAS